MEKQIRILYPVSSVAFGGVETFIQHTAIFHQTSAIKPIYCFFKKGQLSDWMQSETKHDVFIFEGSVRLKNLWSVFKLIAWLKNIIRKADADLVHSSQAYAALFGSIASFLTRKPHIWFQHGPVSGWMDRLAGLLPSRAILYNSKFTLERQRIVMSWVGPLQKIFYPKLTESILTLGASPNASEKKSHPQKIKIGMLCRFQRWKGVDVYLRAIGKVKKELGEDSIEAVLCGDSVAGFDDDSYLNEIERLCQEFKVEKKPFTRDPNIIIQSLDILVNASTTPEPFGLTIVEAMNAGVVPIAPNAGGPKEIIEDGITGLLFEPGSDQNLAQKIILLVKNKNQLQVFSEKAFFAGKTRFSAEKSIKNLESIYFNILSTRSASLGQSSSRS